MSDRVIECPCCGRPNMPELAVVCWPCYRVTERLATVNITDVVKWEKAREERTAS